MEATILVGLIGVGWLFNENENPIDITIQKDKDINYPTGDSIYTSNNINENEKLIKSLVTSNFEQSHDKNSKIINNFEKEIPYKSIPNTDINESYENYTYSSASNEWLPNNEFKSNDQGIEMAPFISKPVSDINFNESHMLSRTQGRNDYKMNKTELSPFFEPEKNSGNIFGNEFNEDTSRYEISNFKTNELPFTQEREQPIDIKSNFNRDINQIIAEKLDMKNIRGINEQKTTYEGRILSGNSIEQRGEEGNVYQHSPDKFYNNTSDRWFVTNGSVLADSKRPTQIIPDTNRQCLNKQPLGPASPTNHESIESRSLYKKSDRQQLCSDTVRNASVESPLLNLDTRKESYHAYPNERDVTSLRNYTSNLKTTFSEPITRIQDTIKKTIKETTIDSKHNGNIGNIVDTNTTGIQDKMKTTKKQTTIDSKNNGFFSGNYRKSTSGYEIPDPTVKETTLSEYTGIAGGNIDGSTLQDNYNNAETNPTREIISQGRDPTTNNVKISNGSDTLNMKIDKLDSDYQNNRQTNQDKLYQNIPTSFNCKLTNMKNRLDDIDIANRIDNDLLNPFKENPYTQPLTSFAY